MCVTIVTTRETLVAEVIIIVEIARTARLCLPIVECGSYKDREGGIWDVDSQSAEHCDVEVRAAAAPGR